MESWHVSCQGLKINHQTPTQMKKIFFVATFLFAGGAYASNEKITKSTVKKVTVFTQGAQVFRSSSINLTPGVTDLVFSGISPTINPASVQAGGKGNFIILDVKHSIKYPEPKKPEEGVLPKEILREITLLEDSIVEIGFIKEEINEKKKALQFEKDMVLKSKLSQGEGKSDSLPVLKEAMELFRQKLNDINAQLGQLKRKEWSNQNNLNRLTARLNDLKTYKSSEDPQKKYEPVHQIIVTVSAEEISTGTVDVSYMVSNAGWVPSYDLRSTTAAAPIQLTYKANVFQNTGEDWNDVFLKLSTGNPNRSNVKPVLPPWYLNYFTAAREAKVSTMGARSQSAENTLATDHELKEQQSSLDKMTPQESAANYSQVIQTMTNVEFDIRLKYNIPADGINHMVSIRTTDLPAEYYHYLVPKIESEAFLVARITGWDDLNLLPGRANVFYEGTYVAETVLNPSIINDTLELALGRDHGITVTRTKLPEKKSNKLLGNDITKTITYQLKMKNNKQRPVNLVVEDQVPVTLNKEIKIEMKDEGKAEYNEKTGLLKWTTVLDSKAYQTFTFSYAVTYNKDKSLSMY